MLLLAALAVLCLAIKAQGLCLNFNFLVASICITSMMTELSFEDYFLPQTKRLKSLCTTGNKRHHRRLALLANVALAII